jgi:hypothetical protein
MNALRINLFIRPDVSPKLHDALSKLPPRPRAELLRKIAEIDLQVTVFPPDHIAASNHSAIAAGQISTPAAEGSLGSDLMSVVEKDFL